jgi:predicted O-methyltransferase YrrM
MSTSTGISDPALSAYVAELGCRESDALARLRRETAEMAESNMQVAPLQGALLQMLVRLTGARRYLEIGVFTGYSSLAVAQALPPDGRIVACDVSEPWTTIARRHWEDAGVADRIELHLAPALQTLARLRVAGQSFDLAFIDADKENMDAYFEGALQLVRPGGLIAVDNVLWGGSVAVPSDERPSTRAIRAFNLARHADPRVDLALVPIADGLTLLRVR